MPTASRPYAEYAARNSAPILEVLQREFAEARRVLEIGSGTGQHAVTFASALEHLHWQPSDLEDNHAGIVEWLEAAGLPNVAAPLVLDVRTAEVAASAYDAVFAANTAHIMGIDAVAAMFAVAGKVLASGGIFCLYGPFRRDGAFNTPSNAEFDVSLRARDPAMGIRDLEVLEDFSASQGLRRERIYAMPSNNLLVTWRKEAT